MKQFKLLPIIILSFVFTITSCKKDEIEPVGENFKTTALNGSDTTNNSENSNQEFLEVTVNNIQELKGIMSFALYNSESTFNDPELAFKEYFIDVDNMPSMSFRFENIPPGEYALAIFHDANSNAELDQNFISIPQEGFGFSNNAMGNFGPPKYDDAKFELKEGNFVTLNINLTHY